MTQQSFFTIHGNNALITKDPNIDILLAKIVIPKELKKQLRDHLFILGITRSILFPDLQNLAKEISIFFKPIN
jgi:hypothetical protein